jgi:outer membrane protein
VRAKAEPRSETEEVRVTARILLAALLLPGLGAGRHASAQGVQAPLQLTLESAIERGLLLSDEVDGARTARQLAESQIQQARAAALPQVAGNVLYTRSLASPFDDIRFPLPNGEEDPLGGLPFGRPHTWIGTLQFSQPLYAGGRVGAALDIARNVRQATDLEFREVEADVTLQVRTGYFDLVLAGQLVSIAEEAYRLADDQLRQVQLFRQQGTVSDFDVLRAQVERDNLEPGIIEAENARRLAELNLKRIINIPAAQPIEAVTPIEPLLLQDIDREPLREALLRRSGLRALDELVSARESAIRIARGGRLPSVGVAGNFSYQGFPDGFVPRETTWRRDWSLSVQVSMPIFDGQRTSGEIGQARAELRQAELQRAQVQETFEIELEAALGDFEAARAQIAARRATVGEARRAVELVELRFRTGLSTQLEISDARLLLQRAQVNEAQALSAYVTALARLERATGGEIPLVAARMAGVE